MKATFGWLSLVVLVSLAGAPLVWACEDDGGAMATAVAPAKPDSPSIPPSPGVYFGRKIAQTMHYAGAEWLVRESREREEDCRTLLGELQLRPGMTVADIGAGNGFYTLPIARQVAPEGKVYAVDIQPEMLKMLGGRARQARLANVTPVLGSVVDPKLPEGKLDLVLLVDVYHEFSHPEQMLAGIRRALKPGGRLVLAEFRAEDPEVPIKPLHKMSKAQIVKELSPNGYRLVREFDDLPWQHLLFFEARTTD